MGTTLTPDEFLEGNRYRGCLVCADYTGKDRLGEIEYLVRRGCGYNRILKYLRLKDGVKYKPSQVRTHVERCLAGLDDNA